MVVESTNGFAAPPQTREELRQLYSRVVKKIAAMSPNQRLATMVRAGIYTKRGKLTKQYGG
jgi:tripartite-type tricarboxylate transporter receptor subunit TctC